MRRVVALALFLVFWSCAPVGETAAKHAVHRGENAVLSHANWTNVPVALGKATVHDLARMAERGDAGGVQKLSESGAVLMVASNTLVRVTGDSYNERHIVIQNGPHAGKSGWVPYEWLRPSEPVN
jgi:hypothetical protein